MKNLDQPKQRFYAPSILSLAAVVLIAIGLFSVGFWAGTALQPQQPTKQAGEVFDRADYKLAQPAFVKIPEELP